MKLFSNICLNVVLCTLLSATVHAYANIEDDSDNFTQFDNQATMSPAVNNNAAFNDSAEIPLAKDDANIGKGALLLNRIQGLEQELRELRGQVELQTHAIELLKQHERDVYKKLDAIMQQNNSKAREENTLGNGLASPSKNFESLSQNITNENREISNPAEEQISYMAAFDLIKQQPDAAKLALQEFILRYPSGGYTANAHYWLGELYFKQQQYSFAKQEFNTVINQFPSSNKCSASLLKIGYALAAEGQASAAVRQLQDVMQKYPDTAVAQLANKKLVALR